MIKQVNKRELLEDNLTMLYMQWNTINSIKDDASRVKHLAKVESWIDSVQNKIDDLARKNKSQAA